jgi:hypothetical protein
MMINRLMKELNGSQALDSRRAQSLNFRRRLGWDPTNRWNWTAVRMAPMAKAIWTTLRTGSRPAHF